MSVFVAINWLLVIATSIVLLAAIRADRSLLVKPSIMVILFFHVLCQWGTALQAGRIESFLAKPWIFALLSQGFPVIGLAVSLFTWRRRSRALWGRIIDRKPADISAKNKALVLLAIFFIFFIFLYLSRVPFHSTGLYKIVFSHATPAESFLARDQSVKFLDNTFLRYGHNIMMAVFAPLLAVLTAQIILVHWQRRNWLWVLFYLVCLGLILLATSISGARAYSAYIVMAIFFAVLLGRGFPIKPVFLVFAVFLILTFPTILSLLREGKVVTVKSFFDYLRGNTLNRVVIIPMETGLHHVHYAQEHGFFGIQAIPKLAAILGIKSLNVPNFIARTYSGNLLDTTTENTAFIYAYYSYFGLIAFIPCLIGLWLLDMCLLVYQKLSDNLLIPCSACISIATNTFSNTEYTISLFSQGFLLLLLVSWAVDRAVAKIAWPLRRKNK
jgi:hypothetical protein